jgi:glycosyltransferase involved in cell wall biosynthesis
MDFSVIIPAHNEEDFIAPCLRAIHEAEKPPGSAYEIIVVLNRCADRTEEIARSHGARIVKEDAKVIAPSLTVFDESIITSSTFEVSKIVHSWPIIPTSF